MSIFLPFLRRFSPRSLSLFLPFFLIAIACRHFSTREESAYYDYYSLPVSCWLSGTFSHWSMVRKSIQTEKQSFSCLVLVVVAVFFVFLSTLSKRWRTWPSRMRWRRLFLCSFFSIIHSLSNSISTMTREMKMSRSWRQERTIFILQVDTKMLRVGD